MRFFHETAFRRLDQITRWLTACAAVAGVVLLLLRALVHFPYFDESIHTHYLWLISAGMKPGLDFFSTYPVLAYLMVEPFFKLFPESAFVLLALRFLSIFVFAAVGTLFLAHGKSVAKDWVAALFPLVLLASSSNIGPFLVEFSIDHFSALAAVGAMLFFFRAPKLSNVAVASALCLLSVAITPKYALPLFFGLTGYLAAAWLDERQSKKIAAAVVAGGLSALLFVILIYASHGISLIENIRTADIMVSKNQLGKYGQHMAVAIYRNFTMRPVLGAVLLLGVAGWAKRSWKNPDYITMSGAGILLGLLIFCLRMKFPLEQYQAPVYISLAVFSPFGFTAFGERPGTKVARGLFAITVLAVVLSQIPAVGREFSETNLNARDTGNKKALKGPNGVAALAKLNVILSKIPREERVVAVWAHHPIYRRDITGMVADDRPSFSGLIDRNDPAYIFFDPDHFRAELQKSPPALIDTFYLENNYPPGWDKVVDDYLARNMNLYQPVPSPMLDGFEFYIRKDLLR